METLSACGRGNLAVTCWERTQAVPPPALHLTQQMTSLCEAERFLPKKEIWSWENRKVRIQLKSNVPRILHNPQEMPPNLFIV